MLIAAQRLWLTWPVLKAQAFLYEVSMTLLKILFGSLLLVFPALGMAETAATPHRLDLTHHWAGYVSLVAMVLAYIAAMLEEGTYLRKSKPMLLGASLIWFVVTLAYRQQGDDHLAVDAFNENLLAFIELMLFIMVSMTYLNAMEDMRVFDALKSKLVAARFGYRKLFWITGFLVFALSSLVNGLTTGLLMGSVVMAVGKENPRFVSLACINIVIASNAGGTFSPLGGISTLFVWQAGMVGFGTFFHLFIPCLVNFLVPAIAMHFAVPKACPIVKVEQVTLQRGSAGVILLFGVTIALAVGFDMLLGLPPAAGMMLGLSLLQFYSFYLQRTEPRHVQMRDEALIEADEQGMDTNAVVEYSYDIFEKIGRLEWDTLLFFYGAMMGIGGLGFIGYLDAVSQWLYGQHDPTVANVLIGLSSAFVDNGTLMFAVLSMHPDIPPGQWLLLTLTLGVGGSLLSIGSAPGIGLLGITKGRYSFLVHLKWFPAILAGYLAAIGTHFLVNARFF